MPAALLKGAEVGKRLLDQLKKDLESRKRGSGGAIELLLVQAGSAPDAESYAKSIRRIFSDVGIKIEDLKEVDPNKSEAACSAFLERVQLYSTKTDGTLVLSPVPPPLDHKKIILHISPDKDIEGTERSTSRVVPPTALSCLELIKSTGIKIQGKKAVVIGRSPRVGRPVADLLLKENATVTVCHSKTQDLASEVKSADIVVAAAGRPGLVKGEWIKKGAIVIDAGENFVNGKQVGDVEFEKASERAAFITPVPGGVGPLTTYMLVRNLIEHSRVQNK